MLYSDSLKLTLFYILANEAFSPAAAQYNDTGIEYQANSLGCANVDTRDACQSCITNCWAVNLHCGMTCWQNGWDDVQCTSCRMGFVGAETCAQCIQPCFQGSVCVNCTDPTVQSNMCKGLYGELGFCAPSGSAIFPDNNGTAACTGAYPDCDVVAGAISGCAIINSSTPAQNAILPAQNAAPAQELARIPSTSAPPPAPNNTQPSAAKNGASTGVHGLWIPTVLGNPVINVESS